MYRIIIFLFIITLTSCFRDPIDLNLNENNKTFVITGWINTLDEEQFINLSQTVDYLGTLESDPVSNANVTITDGIETYTLIEGSIGKYNMPDDWVPHVNNTYELTVISEGIEYTAKHAMRRCPEIENLTYREYDEPGFETTDTLYETILIFKKS